MKTHIPAVVRIQLNISDWKFSRKSPVFTNGDAPFEKCSMTPLFISKSNQVGYAGSKAIYKGPEKCLKVGENEDESAHNFQDLEVDQR